MHIKKYLPSLAIVLPFILSSCAFIQLQKELDEMATTGTIHGKILKTKTPKASLILIAYNRKNKVSKFKLLHKHCEYYAFTLPGDEEYKIAIFADTNNNLKYDPGESSGFWANPNKEVLGFQKRINQELILSPNRTIPSSLVTDISKWDKSKGDKVVIITGAIADLKQKQFSQDYGERGLWTPMKAYERYGIGIYFLEKYDPKKIPILFVYGIGGFAKNWELFFNKIDRSRYQPWFYFYPTGFHIQETGRGLYLLLKELQLKYKFPNLFIVAHSMGGLVASDCIKRSFFDDQQDFVKLFLTISTPWKGEKEAKWAEHAPAIIPCWENLVPESKFIQNISPKDLGPYLSYYLLFTYKGDRNPYRVNNDRIVSLSSVLELKMQARAEKVYGFHLTHSEALTNLKVINLCNKIFDKHNPKNKSIVKKNKHDESSF